MVSPTHLTQGHPAWPPLACLALSCRCPGPGPTSTTWSPPSAPSPPTPRARNTRDAFLAAYAEDGIAFAPGPAQRAAGVAARPVNKNRLEWAPELAEIAASGDLGYTSGPWRFTAEGDGKAVAPSATSSRSGARTPTASGRCWSTTASATREVPFPDKVHAPRRHRRRRAADLAGRHRRIAPRRPGARRRARPAHGVGRFPAPARRLAARRPRRAARPCRRSALRVDAGMVVSRRPATSPRPGAAARAARAGSASGAGRRPTMRRAAAGCWWWTWRAAGRAAEARWRANGKRAARRAALARWLFLWLPLLFVLLTHGAGAGAALGAAAAAAPS